MLAGIPAVTTVMLWLSREELLEIGTPARERYSFLVDDYKPEYYFYETLEMTRKVSLVGTSRRHTLSS